MLKKTLILGIILISLLIISTFSVNAEGYEKIKDYEDDVVDIIDFLSASQSKDLVTVSRPQIDITLLEYEQNGKTVTINLNVKGSISNTGILSEYINKLSTSEGLPDSLDEVVCYQILLSTSINEYEILYVNKEINITCLTEENTYIKPKSYSTDDSRLSITFDLLDSEETYEIMAATTHDAKYVTLIGYYYMDTAPEILNEIDFEVSIDSPLKGNVGKKISFSGEVDADSSEYIWSWDFGDGNTSEGQNPSHIYAEPGDYEVYLEVTDEYLNYGADSYSINITKASGNNVNNQNNDENQEDGLGSQLFIFIALIVIISIVGLAVLIYIIRR